MGEISFLEGVKTTASVIADEDNTTIYVLEARNLKVTFMRAPALAGKFYEYLAYTLSRRLDATQIRYYKLKTSSPETKGIKSEPSSPIDLQGESSEQPEVPTLVSSVSMPEVFGGPKPKQPSPVHSPSKRKTKRKNSIPGSKK